MEDYEITEFLLPKLAAFCSLLCSSLILAEIYRDYQSKSRKSSHSRSHGHSHSHSHSHAKRRLSAVPRALIGMSVGDIFFSAAWFAASWIVKGSEDIRVDYHPTTSTACRIQGFFLQWGYLASLSFNASLAVISLLMVRYNWSERRMVKAFQPVAAMLWLTTLAIAIVPLVLDMYHDTGAVCWISAPPPDLSDVGVDCQDPDVYYATDECQQREDVSGILVPFQILPIWFCIILDSIIMVRIYQKTKEMERKAKLEDTNDFFGLDPTNKIPKKTYNLHGEMDASGSDLSKVASSDQDPLDQLQRADSFRHKFTQYQQERKVMNELQNSNGSMPPLDEGDDEADAVSLDMDELAAGIDEESIQVVATDKPAISKTTTAAAVSTKHTKPAAECHRKCQKRSHGVAVQGMWYIAGFLLTFGVTTISIAAFLITGGWIAPLYRAGYTFFALQGFWNFLVFSRGRRKMRTWAGRMVKALIWDHCFWLCCKCKCLSKTQQEQISPSHKKMERPKQTNKKRTSPRCNSSSNNNHQSAVDITSRTGISEEPHKQARRGSLKDASDRHDTYYKTSANKYKEERPTMTSASDCGWDASQRSESRQRQASRRGSGSGRDHSRRASRQGSGSDLKASRRGSGSEQNHSGTTRAGRRGSGSGGDYGLNDREDDHDHSYNMSFRSDASPASTLRTVSTVQTQTDANPSISNSNTNSHKIRMAREMLEVEEGENENSCSRHSSTIDMLSGIGAPQEIRDVDV